MREKLSDYNHQDMPDNYYSMNHPETYTYDKSSRPPDSHTSMRPNMNIPMPMGNNSIEIPSREDQNINYYQEYCRLFIANVVLTTQMKELVAEKGDLLNKLAKLEKSGPAITSAASNDGGLGGETAEDKRKRFRRVATDIDRHYRCPVENCHKSYGSEGSLNQHMKLKHPELVRDHDFKNKGNKKDSDLQEQKSESSN